MFLQPLEIFIKKRKQAREHPAITHDTAVAMWAPTNNLLQIKPYPLKNSAAPTDNTMSPSCLLLNDAKSTYFFERKAFCIDILRPGAMFDYRNNVTPGSKTLGSHLKFIYCTVITSTACITETWIIIQHALTNQKR